MRRLITVWSLAAVACLAACSPVTPASNVSAIDPTPTATASANTEQIDAKAMYAAEVLYNIPANAYVTLSANNQIDGKTKAYAKAELVTAYKALTVARQAYAVNNVVGFNEAVTLLKTIKANLADKGVK